VTAEEAVMTDAGPLRHGADYPFGATAGPGLLRADGSWVDAVPGRGWPGRTPLVAVGSNAVPEVLYAKLAAADCPPRDVPFDPTPVSGLDVAHSAHVSPGGYVPTTPLAGPATARRLVVSWFTAGQLAALDRTEPNYVRTALEPSCGVPGAEVYVSRWGVLAPGGAPVAPTTQAEIHRILARDAELRQLLPLHDAQAAVAALRAPGVAEQVRSRLQMIGWVRPTGLR
jgi:hypothetical protein